MSVDHGQFLPGPVHNRVAVESVLFHVSRNSVQDVFMNRKEFFERICGTDGIGLYHHDCSVLEGVARILLGEIVRFHGETGLIKKTL